MEGRIAVVSTQDATVRWEATVMTAMGGGHRWVGFSADGASLLHSATTVPGGGTHIARPVPVLTARDAATGQVQRTTRPGTAGPAR